MQKELLRCLKHLKDKKRTVEHGSAAETKVREQGQPSEVSDKTKIVSMKQTPISTDLTGTHLG